jgi:hypothetical protein
MKKETRNNDKVYVKTTYSRYQEDDITGYDTEEEANNFISTCLRWGIGIVSCEIINKG